MLKDPVAVEPTVKVDTAVMFAVKVTAGGLNIVDGPAGEANADSPTVPVSPLKLVIMTVAFFEEPTVKSNRLGLTIRPNLGPGPVTLINVITESVKLPLDPVTVMK